jgi:hypothetical protein
LPDPQGTLKGALNVVVADKRVLDGPEDLTVGTTAQIGLYTHRGYLTLDRLTGDLGKTIYLI